MLEYLNNLFSQVNPDTAYLILLVSAFVENTLPPIPGDTVTVIGAYLITIGKLGFWGVYISTTVGSILGFFTMYLLGLKFGRSFLNSKFKEKIFNANQIKKVELWFGKYGYWVITANRFLSGTRSVISLFAGFFHLRWYWVLLLSSISALIWNGLLISAGYALGSKWEQIFGILSNYNKVVIVITVVLIGYFLLRRWKKKRNQSSQNSV